MTDYHWHGKEECWCTCHIIGIRAVPWFGCTTKGSMRGNHGRPSGFLEVTGTVCFLAVSGIDKEQKGKRYRAKKTQSHFSCPCAPWVQTPSDSTFSIVTSAALIVCALWLQWMAGSPLNIINGSPLLYFAECSSALGHCNNLQKQRKGLGIYEMSPFQPSGRNTARCRCGCVLTRVNLSLLLL